MANTVSILSYANTFGDWVATTNSLVRENNDFAANNYIKPTGTLYLNAPLLGLQVANNAVIAGGLQVQGTGSSGYIQNNFRVDGISTIAGSNIVTANVIGSGTALSVSNNASVAGVLTTNALSVSNNATVAGNVSAMAFFITGSGSGLMNTNITGNAGTVNNGIYLTGSYANPAWITSLANTKITGLVTSGQIATVANTQITGLITGSQIASGTLPTTYSTFNTTSQLNTQGNQTGSVLNANTSLGGIMVQGPGTTNAAYMSFHRPGIYAAYFGLDTDNNFAVGGWSAGAALASMKVGSFGVGTAASGTAGEIRATNNITSYYSDDRLKNKLGNIQNALESVKTLNGFYYKANDLAQSLGYTDKTEVGMSAQEVQKILPEIVVPAPIDDKYLTIHYERIIPLLVEAIKELSAEVEKLKK
jgi:hypothetical protein